MSKKFLSYVASLLMLVGCSNEDSLIEQQGNAEGMKTFTSFTATLDDVAGTRAFMANGQTLDSKKHISWNDGDYISVFSDIDRELKHYRLENIRNNSATFTGENVMGTKFFGVYPAQGWTVDKNNPDILHYTTYSPTVNSDEEYSFNIPMVARSNTNNLTFKQVMGAVHISFQGVYRLRYAYFIGYNNESLGGTGTIDLSAEKPVFKVDEDAEDINEVNGIWFDKDQITDSEAKDIYFFIPPMTLEDGFYLEIHGYDEDGKEVVYTKPSNNKLTVEPGKIYHFETVDAGDLTPTGEPIEFDYDTIYNALMDFYYAMNGDNWEENYGWGNKDLPFSEWYGLDADGNTVYSIDMQYNKVTGDVPASIANISSLQSFVIAGRLWDDDEIVQYPDVITLPAEFSQLTNLLGLTLSGCSLSTLPDLSGMTKLGNVELEDNQLSGTLPEVFATLPNLSDLKLANNLFSGSIPASYFKPAGDWRHLDLFDNQLSGTITKAQQQSQMWQNIKDINLNHQKNGDVIVEGSIYYIGGFDEDSFQLSVGEEKQLPLKILHDNAQDTSLTYSIVYWEDNNGDWGESSDSAPFSIDQNGKVKALRTGYGEVSVKPAVGYGVTYNFTIEVSASVNTGNEEFTDKETINW